MADTMKLFYAHYPALEDAFLHYVAEERKNPSSPWLVLCASTLIGRRLASQLAERYGAVANIHFVTLPELLAQLDAEAGPARPLFPQHHLRDFLIKNLLERPSLNRYSSSRGFIEALKSSLRDLADSYVTPEVLTEHLADIRQDEVLGSQSERFEWFIKVYEAFEQAEKELKDYRPYQDFFDRALQQIETSAFLRRFERMVLYGFYDMTGRQLKLLEQLRTHYDLVTFAPYQKHPAYQFAERFFTTNYLGVAQTAKDVNSSAYGALGNGGKFLFASVGSAPGGRVQLVSAASKQSEVFFVAKEILRLVREEQVAWKDIAVIARDTTPYQQEVRRAFEANHIALNASFSYPLSHYPLGIFCWNLLSLVENGFDRATVQSVFNAPYFKPTQKEKWQQCVLTSPVSRGLEQWEALLPKDNAETANILSWMHSVRQMLENLSQAQRWQNGSALLQQFLQDQIDLSALSAQEQSLYQTVLQTAASLAAYQSVRPQSYPGELLREFKDALIALHVNEVEHVEQGVFFTDALRARGLQFKIVFLLGVNEKSFPRIVPKDAIFWDEYRALLRDGLGYWVPKKSEQRAEEEKLLFFTTVTAAQRKLYVSFSAAGADGKEQAPSVYAAELARALELPLPSAARPSIGARTDEKLQAVAADFWTEHEFLLAGSLEGEDAEAVYRAGEVLNEPMAQALHAAQALRGLGLPSAFDGFIGEQSGRQIFEAADKKGFSPSALQDLASCPMKYFFSRALHLKTQDDLLDREALAENLRGTLMHEILHRFYAYLNEHRLPVAPNAPQNASLLREIIDTYRPKNEYGIYPFLWNERLDDLQKRLEDFLLQDEEHLAETGFVPHYFEKEFEGLALEDLMHLRGTIDRIETAKKDSPDAEGKNGFHVSDYKSSYKGTTDLAKDFFAEFTFQPFIYTCAALQLPELAETEPGGFSLLSLKKNDSNGEKRYSRQDLSPERWRDLYPHAVAFLTRLTELMKNGIFFLQPPASTGKDYKVRRDGCKYCAFTDICRRDSFACLYRARYNAQARATENLRAQAETFFTQNKEKEKKHGRTH